MAEIPDRQLIIEKAIEGKTYQEEARTYLGVSGLGHPCSRALYYEFRWFLPPEVITARQKRLFSRGHKEEPIILEDLKAAGVKILSTQKGATACFGHIGAHLDSELIGVPDAPKTPHLGEFKTSATKYFNPLLKSQSVKKSFLSHYCQCQGYMHLFGLTRCLYICVNKEDDRRYYERIKYDKNFALGLFEKGEEIVMALRIPDRISDDPKYYRCHENFCRFRDLCHFPTMTGVKVNKTCRSCKFAEVHDKGRWKCGNKKTKRKFMKKKAQLKKCKRWDHL